MVGSRMRRDVVGNTHICKAKTSEKINLDYFTSLLQSLITCPFCRSILTLSMLVINFSRRHFKILVFPMEAICMKCQRKVKKKKKKKVAVHVIIIDQ